MAESLLALRDVLVRHGDRTALEVSRIEVQRGEVLALLGPNGAGKTTLLRVMGLLQTPNSGKIYFKGNEADAATALAIRQRIANVFQEPLLLNASVYRNAALGLKLRGLGRREIERRLRPWLERLAIEHLAERSGRTLSGGEAQRTSLARALALEPDLLLLDEPFSALDSASRESLLRDFQRIVRETGVTTVLVTHDRHEAFALADRVGVLEQGRLLQLGAGADVFQRPASPAVAEIVGIENRLPGIVLACVGAHARIAVAGAEIDAAGRFDIGDRLTLCIRADDVAVEPAGCVSDGRNCLKGKVADVSPAMDHYRVTVHCGSFGLVARLERNRFHQGGFSQGDEVIASFSPAAVHGIAQD